MPAPFPNAYREAAPQPGQEPLSPPANPSQPEPAIVEQPDVLEDPQAGGSYTRDPSTGALTLATPSTDNT